MDPDEALRELRVLTAQVHASDGRITQAGVERAAELFTGLDEWLSRGGWLPGDWDDAFVRVP